MPSSQVSSHPLNSPAAYYAHTARVADGSPDADRRHWQPLADHLWQVAAFARRFAAPLGLGEEAELAGLLHDLGKYSARFQQRLHDPRIHGVNHWSVGAAPHSAHRSLPVPILRKKGRGIGTGRGQRHRIASRERFPGTRDAARSGQNRQHLAVLRDDKPILPGNRLDQLSRPFMQLSDRNGFHKAIVGHPRLNSSQQKATP